MESSIALESDALPGSVTLCLVELKRGSADAQEWFFHRVLPEVTRIARSKLRGRSNRHFDEEDVAAEVVSALIVFAHTFHQLQNRSDLRRLISKILRNKKADAHRREKRYTKLEVGAFWSSEPSCRSSLKNEFAFLDDSHAIEMFSIEFFDSLSQVIRSLDDDELQCRKILQLLAEGYSTSEISLMVGRGERSIQRLKRRIEQEFQRISQFS